MKDKSCCCFWWGKKKGFIAENTKRFHFIHIRVAKTLGISNFYEHVKKLEPLCTFGVHRLV